MLSSSCFVQTNSGSTGAGAAVTTMTATLPSGTTVGNALVLCFGADVNAAFPDDGTFIQMAGEGTVEPFLWAYSRDAVAGETSWTISVSPADIGWWFVAEISDLASLNTYVDPTFNTFQIGVDYEAGGTGSCATIGSSFTSATCDTINSPPGPLTANGDDLVLAVGTVKKTSGASPSLTSCTDVGAGQPGTLTQIGSTIKTTRGAGSNISAAIFYRLSGGTRGIAFNARFTWASAGFSAGALMVVIRAEWVVPQQTSGRASTNSMV